MKIAAGVLLVAMAASTASTASAERSQPSGPADYEAEARALYADQPDFEKTWPLEFQLRVLEGLTQDIERSLLELGHGLEAFADAPAKKVLKKQLAVFEFLERARLVVKNGTPDPARFVGVGVFELAGLLVTGERCHRSARASFVFVRLDRGWRLESLELDNEQDRRSDGFAFVDVTDAWLSPDARAGLRRTTVSDLVHRDLVAGRQTALQPVAMDAHPGIAVIDLDSDGWEDLALWDVQGAVVYLRNDRGRFVAAPAGFGPPLRDVTALVTVDLDNDGHRDIIVGRFFAASSILWSDGDGGYKASELELPSSVASLAVADIDHDGLLDVFFATAAHDYHGRSGGRAISAATGPVDANVGRVGPKNALFRNAGERRLEDVTRGAGLALDRSTLQAAFVDTDRDGFPELILGNDFAPANFYRNRGGRFVDDSKATGVDQIFFGMGITVGDQNGDGHLDVFISAMSSSAGRRVVGDGSRLSSKMPEWNRRARALAHRGNTLLLGAADGSLRDGSEGVRDANWAYGGIFVDANSDGDLDLYVPNGFLTSSLEPDGTTRDL